MPTQQLDQHGCLKHFLTIEGLPRHLLHSIMDQADVLLGRDDQIINKAPLLSGKTVIQIFFEDSTRTRTTFEIAAKNLSANVVNFNVRTSSTSKGEHLLDTLRNLEAMHADLFVVRHPQSGAAHFIAGQVKPHIAVVNAGDGRHAHPTQAMLDMLTIRRHKGDRFPELRVAIVGDILHSRVARSQIHALNILGAAEVRVVAPKTLLPVHVEKLGVHAFNNMEEALQDVDVVMMLRLQKERMEAALLPSERAFYTAYGLTRARLALAKPDAIVMHPGPINRGVEIASDVADGPQSVILHQVSYGVAVRMAVLGLLGKKEKRGSDAC